VLHWGAVLPPIGLSSFLGPALFNAKYLDFARHHGFEIVACNPGRGQAPIMVQGFTKQARGKSGNRGHGGEAPQHMSGR
jgi:hypothetical protein